MKVPVRLELDVDVKAWSTAYGIHGADAIRADVQEYVANIVHEHLANTGMLHTTP